MPLTAEDLTAIVTEIAPAVSGARIQKIRQPSPLTLTLELRARSRQNGEARRTLTLLLSVEPDLGRVHFVTRRLASPATAPPFCQFLRAHLQGAQMEHLNQIDGDRIVRFQLTTRQGPRALIAELIGRNGDLLVLDASDTVIAALRRGQGRVGRPYAAPRRPRPRGTPQGSHPEELRRAKRPLEGSLRPTRATAFPVSAALEERYEAQAQTAARERQRTARLAELRKQIKKTRRHIEALRGDLEKADRYRDHARYGDLLKANLGRIAKGQHEVTVVDYFDPAMPGLLIPLDPARSPQGNMEDYFRKHRKYLTAEREVRPRLGNLERQLQTLQDEVAGMLQETWQPPVPDRSERAKNLVRDRRIGTAPRAAIATPARPVRSGPFRRFTSSDGLPVYVGRNAKENEELTFGLAHSDDLWLHAHGVPGSHVVVRLERGADPPIETLRDAATLALLYSDLKKSGKGEVIYAKRKYVRKLKGQPAGTVSVTQEKAIFVQLDRLRLQRLKDSQGR